ncbi:HNH endonuclease [Pleomorphomonas sp. JP5]|uniref:HNH endonuclease n=1 Tax=Pleomorphomonas sp. JP5 TaxID=2942998 RepID=UPI002044A595|nr:HNH endonuclease signature motif containing protein [Pleomorphomonas sp. JP5]MCM5557496.1 HNH endonuclease [Pleomorphomonas sp. JP5]
MRKIAPANVDFATALAESVRGISDIDTQRIYVASIPDPKAIEEAYLASAYSGVLCSMPRTVGNGDPIVYGSLHKSELMKLYTQYFVQKGKPARELYDLIKVSAGGKCPLCGGVGSVRTLDHYLPKSTFPLYSVMPANLVPCCRDCNTDKLDGFSESPDKQALHPYFDDSKFFTEKWIEAKVVPGLPPVIEYYVSAPENWSERDKSRVSCHFKYYRLASKFSVEAAADIPETIHVRRTIMSSISPYDFSMYLFEKGQTPALPINNWRRVMFSALAMDPWFCENLFDEI